MNAGCFAAGTKLWTPTGYRAVEEFQANDWIYSRSEHDPEGPITARRVQEVFVRYAGVLHLHLGGQVIRTTHEHPFFVEGTGWTKASLLQPGDRVLCADGQCVQVEEAYDTGDWETVYNLRVEEDHTYFVGEESWGWAAWVHNVYFGPNDMEGCTKQRIVNKNGWSDAAAEKVAKLGAEAGVHGNVLLDYTEWWIKKNKAILNGILPGMSGNAQEKIDNFVALQNIDSLRYRFRLRGELAGKTALPQPETIRANPYNLSAETLQLIIDDIYMYAFRGDSVKDNMIPLALTIATDGTVVLSQSGSGVEPRAVERARYYFGTSVRVTMKTTPRLLLQPGNIHAEEAAISLLERSTLGLANGAKQVCTWYACHDCAPLQQQYGITNLTGLASAHNGNYRRWTG